MTMADPAPRFDSAGNEVSALDSNSGGIFSEYYFVSESPMISQWDSYMIPGSELVAFEPDASDAVLMLDDGASSDVVLLLEDGAYILSVYQSEAAARRLRRVGYAIEDRFSASRPDRGRSGRGFLCTAAQQEQHEKDRNGHTE